MIGGDFIKILLDAGHGGNDSGAVGPTGLYEKNVVLNLTNRIGALLTSAGIEVHYTRRTDVYVSLQNRTTNANNLNVDYFVSVHCNAATAITANGIETFAYLPGGEGEELARDIQNHLIDRTKRTNRGVKFANFYVIKYTRMPAVLVECCFISNAAEERLLRDNSFLESLANGIYGGIIRFLDIQPEYPQADTMESHRDSLIDRKLIQVPSSWQDLSQPITKGELVTLLNRTIKYLS